MMTGKVPTAEQGPSSETNENHPTSSEGARDPNNPLRSAVQCFTIVEGIPKSASARKIVRRHLRKERDQAKHSTRNISDIQIIHNRSEGPVCDIEKVPESDVECGKDTSTGVPPGISFDAGGWVRRREGDPAAVVLAELNPLDKGTILRSGHRNHDFEGTSTKIPSKPTGPLVFRKYIAQTRKFGAIGQTQPAAQSQKQHRQSHYQQYQNHCHRPSCESCLGQKHRDAYQERRHQRQLSPLQDLGPGNSDPFGVAAIPITPSLHRYITHYQNTVALFTLPTFGDEYPSAARRQAIARVPINLSDALWLHATVVATSADMMEMMRKAVVPLTSSLFPFASRHHLPLAPSHDYVVHKTQTISILRSNLAANTQNLEQGMMGSPALDSSIYAVANLAVGSATVGNYAEFRMHMAGLQRMVILRGGVACLTPDLAFLLSIIDVKLSLSTGSGTQFEGESIFAASFGPEPQPSSNAPAKATVADNAADPNMTSKAENENDLDLELASLGSLFRIKRHLLSTLIHHQLFPVLAFLRAVAIDWEMCRRCSTPMFQLLPQALDALSIRELRVEYALLNWNSASGGEKHLGGAPIGGRKTRASSQGLQEAFSTCVSLAAVGFVNTGVVSNDPGTASNLDGLRIRLRQTLAEVWNLVSYEREEASGEDEEENQVVVYKIILWVCFLGAYLNIPTSTSVSTPVFASASEMTNRAWFVQKLHVCAARLRLDGRGSGSNWEVVRNILAGTFYIGRFYDVPFREIWEESCRV